MKYIDQLYELSEIEDHFENPPKEHKITEVIISSFYLANIIYQKFN